MKQLKNMSAIEIEKQIYHDYVSIGEESPIEVSRRSKLRALARLWNMPMSEVKRWVEKAESHTNPPAGERRD